MKPLIKWSGGKYDEIKFFEKHIPINYETYIEPFFGGGGVFFSLNPQKAVINDTHTDLINFYNCIKNNKSNEIYNFMKENLNNEETYYNIRDNFQIKNNIDSACSFYYLRKTAFRGMIRYNKNGKFNIPYGKYKTINYEVLNDENYTKLLQRTEIFNKDFEFIFNEYNDENNFVFLDPPYDSKFTNYMTSFTHKDHERLFNCFKNTKNKCLMIIGKTDFITNLYSDYIIEEYNKKYKFRLLKERITSENIDNKHLIIKNYK